MLEAQLKQYNQDLSKSKMTGTLLVAVFMMAFMSFISSSYAVSFFSFIRLVFFRELWSQSFLSSLSDLCRVSLTETWRVMTSQIAP